MALVLGCSPPFGDPGTAGPAAPRETSEWPHYGGDAGGQRFSSLTHITRQNVGRLEVAWTVHTGDVSDGRQRSPSTTSFQATPILVEGRLYACTPFNRVLALDPVTGGQHWSYDPKIDLSGGYANQLVCRGVTAWRDTSRAPREPCALRIFTATNDARLIALDGGNGQPCADFGPGGEIDLNPDAGEQRWRGEYQVTSPPVVVEGLVIVGSAVGDNQRWDAPSGVIRGFDARSGALAWAWDMGPPGFVKTAENTSRAGYVLGTPNAWAPLSVDEERGLVFVPTGNPMLDYYKGRNPELSYYGSSVVALQARTGEVVWHYQTVHHDLWDFDVPAQPTLTVVRRDGREIPAVVQATKMGMLFVLDRRTGRPLFPVEERPVPQGGVPGEKLSPTQPFPSKPPPLIRHALSADDAWGVALFDRAACRRRIRSLRHEGIYTPPSLQGSIMFPGNAGGSNWGGVAVDPERQVLIANVTDLPWIVRLMPREEFERTERDRFTVELSPQEGTPYGLWREPLLSPLLLPCVKPPWGRVAAVDLVSGDILWKRPFGTVADLIPVISPHWELGTPNLGGPLVTASGLIFIGAAMDDYLRALDLETGEELWRARLPAGGQATPMTYEAEGAQYIVIAAGGHGRLSTRLGDAIVAFRLPRP